MKNKTTTYKIKNIIKNIVKNIIKKIKKRFYKNKESKNIRPNTG